MSPNDSISPGSDAELELRLPEGRTGFAPGQPIEVEARWWLREPAETIELRLVWYTSGRGDQDVEIVEVRRLLGAAQGAPANYYGQGQTGSRTVQLELPPEPYSFSGQLITLTWALELVVDEGRASTRRDIVSAPGGTEVRLRAIEPAASGSGPSP